MTAISIILFYIGMSALVLLGIIIIYNLSAMCYWVWKNKYDKTNTQYEAKKIRKHRESLIAILPVMFIIVLGILLYKMPVDFEGITEYNKPLEEVEKLNTYTFRNDEEVVEKPITNKQDVSDILKLLNNYKYVKNVSNSRFTNIKQMTEPTIRLDFKIKDVGKRISYISLSISGDGYICNDFSGQAYRVKADDRRELFNKLLIAITNQP